MLSIETSPIENQFSLELDLKHQFRNETQALEILAANIKNKTDEVKHSFHQFQDEQHNTDRIWNNFIEEKIERSNKNC